MVIERMKGMDYIDQTRAYCDYLEEHLTNVAKAFEIVSKACQGMPWVGDDKTWFNIREDVVNHDLSKFSEAEFVQYRNYFYPIDGNSINMDDAWENHKAMNHHHHETAETEADTVHLVVDWLAMSLSVDNALVSIYYNNNKAGINLPDELTELLETILNKVELYMKENI